MDEQPKRWFQTAWWSAACWAGVLGAIWWFAAQSARFDIETDPAIINVSRTGRPVHAHKLVPLEEPIPPTIGVIAARGLAWSAMAVGGWWLLRTAFRSTRQRKGVDRNERRKRGRRRSPIER